MKNVSPYCEDICKNIIKNNENDVDTLILKISIYTSRYSALNESHNEIGIDIAIHAEIE